MEEFGKHLRSCRKQRRMTQTELARIVGVAPAYVSQIESALRMPSLKVAKKFADALRVELPVLLGTSEGTPLPPDRLTDPQKLEVLRSLIRSIEFDLECLPRREDLEPFPGATAVQISDGEESVVRLYRFGETDGAVKFLSHHPGEETIYCAAGRLRVVVENEEQVLSTGEAFSFDANRPHTVLGDAGSIAVSTVNPPPTARTLHRVPVEGATHLDLQPPGPSSELRAQAS
jgi:transcriptional regulator with XRE-family HTH domain